MNLAKKGLRLSHRSHHRAIVTAPNLVRIGSRLALAFTLAKNFANARDERILPNQAVAGKPGPPYVQDGNTDVHCPLEYRAVSTNYNLIAALASRADNLRHGVAT